MKRILLQPTALLIVILAAACARAPVDRIDWPDDIPDVEYYERLYDQDLENQAVQSRKEYLRWVVRFYEGWKLHQDGWHRTTRDVLHAIEDEPRKARLRAKMARLGQMISGEWAKNSENRRIRSRELSIWGQALLSYMDRGEEERFVDRVTRDVKALRGNKLDPQEIDLSRY
ncbi:MAG: hypothetical protein U5R46_06580 [Gammaproteobacteria bacterium]|nr:hypothetical protein [Gammaproteobacteria bacterium]